MAVIRDHPTRAAERRPVRDVRQGHADRLDFEIGIDQRAGAGHGSGDRAHVVVFDPAVGCRIRVGDIETADPGRHRVRWRERGTGRVLGPGGRAVGGHVGGIDVAADFRSGGVVVLNKDRTVAVGRFELLGSGDGAEPAIHLVQPAGGYGDALIEDVTAARESKHAHHVGSLMRIVGADQHAAPLLRADPVGDAIPPLAGVAEFKTVVRQQVGLGMDIAHGDEEKCREKNRQHKMYGNAPAAGLKKIHARYVHDHTSNFACLLKWTT